MTYSCHIVKERKRSRIFLLRMKQIFIKSFTQQRFQHCFNVVFWLIRQCDVGQRLINGETTLCILTLKCATSNNVESTLCISTLISTTLGNVKPTLSFSTSIFTTFVNVETKLWKRFFSKIQNFNDYLIILFTLVAMLKGISWRRLAKLQKFFKDHEKYCIART